MNYPCIIVVCFNRPNSLSRLLNSLENATYPVKEGIPLIISIDAGGDDQVIQLAKDFSWNHGSKEIIIQLSNLGIKKHVLQCISHSEKYGSVLILEEDVYVSKYFYCYGIEALNFYNNDSDIAGISLYKQPNNFNLGIPFFAVEDGYDVFFLQIPASSGQMFTKKSWLLFKEWYDSGNDMDFSVLPKNMRNWSSQSWVKCFSLYLHETKRTFVYPRVSLTTNFGDLGHHSPIKSFSHQATILMNEKNFRFCHYIESNSRYDTYFEYCACQFEGVIDININDLDVDLQGDKPRDLLKKKYVLTRRVSSKPIQKFGLEMKPPELNILCKIEGEEFALTEVKHLKDQKTISPFIHWSYNYTNVATLDFVKFLFHKFKSKFL